MDRGLEASAGDPPHAHTHPSRTQYIPGASLLRTLCLGGTGGRLQSDLPPSRGPGREKAEGIPVQDELAERVKWEWLEQTRQPALASFGATIYMSRNKLSSHFWLFSHYLTNSIFISVGPERPTLGGLASGLLSGESQRCGQEEEPGRGSSDKNTGPRESQWALR